MSTRPAVSPPLPEILIPPAPDGWDPFQKRAEWPVAAILPSFTRADGQALAIYPTQVQVCYNQSALYVHFQCTDPDIWGTHTQRDDPIYNEEVVELFLGSGEETPTRYVELEISPLGVLFDAWVDNPTGRREEMGLDVAWNCPDIRWQVDRQEAAQRWTAILALPWAPFLIGPDAPLPRSWRANFYRIERPRGREPEFSCWSPTLTDPADFHKPARFGHLRLDTA